MAKIKDIIDRILDGIADVLSPEPDPVPVPARANSAKRPRR